MKCLLIFGLALVWSLSSSAAPIKNDALYWIKVKANDKYQRTEIAEMGLPIEVVEEDYVITMGTQAELESLKKKFEVLVAFEDPAPHENFGTLDYPEKDSKFHNFDELTAAIKKLAEENPEFVQLDTIGQSLEGRDLFLLTLTSNQKDHLNQPAVVFMGGHHAREHLSVEMTLMLAQELVTKYNSNDSHIKNLLDTRTVYIIPIVNPDGAEYDIAAGTYRSWRKNRRQNNNGTRGVDLNRNYGYKWGTVGTSKNPNSDVFCGPSAFSEPETQVIRDFLLSHENINILLTYHTFSELILYPWGHSDQKLEKDLDYQVHSTMARKMAEWNQYTPQQSSDLYLTSGDTTDWSYGELGIISFTFELDPKSIWQGGFYPGQSYIQPVFEKNWNPAVYLIEYADNPYRVTRKEHENYGLSTPIL